MLHWFRGIDTYSHICLQSQSDIIAYFSNISASPTYCYCQTYFSIYPVSDEMARERTGHLPLYAEAKKMKSLTLHTHGCPIGLA